MYQTHNHGMAQVLINERLAEAQRERLVRAARASAPRPIEFRGSTGSFAAAIVAPVKKLFAAFGHAAQRPVTGLHKTASRA